MLSYQHSYHAGNLADLHKHALLAQMLDYLTAKDKPLSYLETHAGRGAYDLDAEEARKTGEAAHGIDRALAQGWLDTDHPLIRALVAIRSLRGPRAYPGSPLIAGHFLRFGDRAHLAELHPAEHAALRRVAGFAAIHQQDGFQMAQAICPPDPRRGLLLIDPSYEVKDDYLQIPRQIALIARKWNVGIIALWVPILSDLRHLGMIAVLDAQCPGALWSQVEFPPVRPGHGMIGSGLWVLNPPWPLPQQARALEGVFRARL